uniref:Anaphase-promoting complex subunit 11 n=1 Tax=Rhabditophanes sp. KR3021 TaxID=114890 RepID=A0AC35TSM5_9BILA
MDRESSAVDLYGGKFSTLKSNLGAEATIESDEDSDTCNAPWKSDSSDESQDDDSIGSKSSVEYDGPPPDNHALFMKGGFDPMNHSKGISRTAKRAQLAAMDLKKEADAVDHPKRTRRPTGKPVRSRPTKQNLPSTTELSIVIKKYKFFSEWKWTNGSDDTCGICRMPFEACCIECKTPGDECPLVVGTCRHPFHLHCINKWTDGQATKPHCPLCRQEWKNGESILGVIS